ncbi:MAG: C40 family peptidase [Burkholderiales bacterium]|nr:C40 family peptidase [Burkholderiales bacterium]
MARPSASAVTVLALAAMLAAAPARGDGVRPVPASGGGVAEVAWRGAQDLVIYALGLVGVRYRYGGETPEGGLDCSGLVRHVFGQVAGIALPRTSKELARIGEPVVRADLRAGDLVFFNTRGFAYSHVGIFLGDGRFVQAPSRGSAVAIADLGNGYWSKRYNGARRLVGVLPELSAGDAPPALAASITP